jgi:hypothetical protein
LQVIKTLRADFVFFKKKKEKEKEKSPSPSLKKESIAVPKEDSSFPDSPIYIPCLPFPIKW